jgi:CHAT domain-containing protein
MAGMHHSGEQKDYGLTAFEAGYAALDRGHPNAAEAFFQETILFARATRRPDLGAMAALWRAVTFSRAGDFEAVSEQTRLAQDFLQTIESPAARARVSASAGAILGPAKITARPREVLSEAIDFFDRTGARTWLPQLLHQRAIVEEREGDRESAERDLRRAITVAEDVLGQGATAEARYGFSAEVHAIYSELIGLLLRNDRGEEALDVAERSRLITRRRPTTRRPVLKIAADLPHSTSVAVYEMQPTSVVVWTLSRGEVRMFQSPATPREIVHLTEGWNAKGPSLDALADLYDALMRPWAPEMAGGELVIIPAPGLETVPYAALYDRDARRHILDDFVVTVRTCLADVAGLDLPAGSDVGRVLIVADAEYRRMERLPESRREASQVNALHPGSVMLLGEEATGPRFLSELTQATALHFAGHATVNEVAPEMSALVVTGTGGDDDGRIYVHQLLNRSLPLRLVVLSACSTARTRTGDVRGNVTIARAFLDGGAAAVVATLWPVSDDDAATFSIRFHENLRAGATPAVAVRLAQLYVRAHTSSAAAWAAFCVMQGAA